MFKLHFLSHTKSETHMTNALETTKSEFRAKTTRPSQCPSFPWNLKPKHPNLRPIRIHSSNSNKLVSFIRRARNKTKHALEFQFRQTVVTRICWCCKTELCVIDFHQAALISLMRIYTYVDCILDHFLLLSTGLICHTKCTWWTTVEPNTYR